MKMPQVGLTNRMGIANVYLEFGPRASENVAYYDANAAPDALWGQPSANGCRNQATRLPTGALHWWHGDKVAKTSCPPPYSPRYRRDMRSPTPTDTSYTARARTRPREDSHPNNTFVPRTRRGGGAAHAAPPPAHTARVDHKAKERENDGRYPSLRWPGRAFARGLRAGTVA